MVGSDDRWEKWGQRAWRTVMSEIRRLREARGWSVRRLAREAGVTPRAVAKWERDGVANMRLACAIRVAEALDVPVYDLVEGERGRWW